MSKKWINAAPDRASRLMLGAMPLMLLLVLYFFVSDARLAENSADKLFPSFAQMGQAAYKLAFEVNPNTGSQLLWSDTYASLVRLLFGVLISAVCALVFGLLMGAIPVARAVVSPLVVAIALIPALAILPILTIIFGVGEASKIILIVIGLTPLIARDLQQYVQSMPQEQLIKAQTLGGNSSQIIMRVMLPQVMPRLFDAVRLSLTSAWLFLIAAESIAATEGLGYRIFLQQRYLAMDSILPLVAWMTLLAFLLDRLMWVASKAYWPWYHANK
jgi:NitT/TauT family transport system permease protein